MKYLLLLLSLFCFPSCEAREKIKIAVVDTGLDIQDPRFKDVICKEGHKDFTNTTLDDVEGHGSAVVSLIKQYAGNANYCLLIYKYFSPNVPGYLNSVRMTAALNKAIISGAKIVNISGGGKESTEYEYGAMIQAYKHNVLVIAAAGNNGEDLAEHPFYPAAYNLNNIYAIGNILDSGVINPTSNYGDQVLYEKGTHVKVACLNPLSKSPCYMSGSSMSTAIFTGKLIKGWK